MNKYNKDYFERGEELGISGYTNYRWMPDLTIPMCERFISYLGIKKGDNLLDYGCAKGYSVDAFNRLGYNCFGVDISEYAISKCNDSVKDKLKIYNGPKSLQHDEFKKFDYIFAKDVFEHIEKDELKILCKTLYNHTNTLFIVVPLGENGKYIVPEYEGDITHVIRENKEWWESFLIGVGFKIRKSEYIVKGIKDNWSQYEKGNGFFVLDTL